MQILRWWNYLDLIVKDPINTPFQPFVLDETPDPITLDLPATNGKDDLNNMEQVLFDLPAAGDYTIENNRDCCSYRTSTLLCGL